MQKKKKRIIIPLIVLAVLLAAFFSFFQFTKMGYLLSIRYKPSFREIAPNVYINKGNSMSDEEALSIYNQATDRVTEYFGELRCRDTTTLIICDDETISNRIGYKETLTQIFPEKKDYICLDMDYFNVDVVAHEFTHAELHSHLSADTQRSLPTWFDEGLATQNDYRERYSTENWIERTENGKKATPLEDMDEPSEFQCSDEQERQYHYLCAKHEVAEWIEAHSVQELMEMVDKVEAGEDFYTLYGK